MPIVIGMFFLLPLLLGLVLDLGVTPLLVLGALWMVQTASYHRAVQQTDSKKTD